MKLLLSDFQIEDPDSVGRAAYRAVHEILEDIVLNDTHESREALAEALRSELEEVISEAQELRRRINVAMKSAPVSASPQ